MPVSPTTRGPEGRPAQVERRRFPRSACLENATSVEWWGRSQRWMAGGRLRNISASGALFEGEALPPVRESIWLRMDHPVRTTWIAGQVVREDPAGAVGIAFLGPVPDLVEAATQGIGFGHLLGDDSED